MDDDLEPSLTKNRRQRGGIRKVRAHELKSRHRFQPFQPGHLEIGIIVVVEIVEADDRAAFLQIALRHMEADEACGTGDEYGGHRRGFSIGVWPKISGWRSRSATLTANAIEAKAAPPPRARPESATETRRARAPRDRPSANGLPALAVARRARRSR